MGSRSLGGFLTSKYFLVGVVVSSVSLMLLVAMMTSFGMWLVAFGERFEVLLLVCIVLLVVPWCCNNLLGIMFVCVLSFVFGF